MKNFFLLFILSCVLCTGATAKTIHVLVALCDNENQGIVKVPAALGNGQDPRNNLYWGAMYGTKTYLAKQAGFQLTHTIKNPRTNILERAVFTFHDTTIVADAYDGRCIREAVQDFFTYAAGSRDVTVTNAVAGSSADLLVFVGHNAFMDSAIPVATKPGANQKKRNTAVFACASKPYFLDRLQALNTTPLILTTGLMAPEAYTLEALIRGFHANKSAAEIHEMVAQAYNKFQKCGINGARRLFYQP